MRCLPSPGTTVPLLLHNLIAVSTIIVAIQCSYLVSVCGSVSVTSQPIQLSGSGKLFLGRRRFGRLGRLELFLSCPLLTFLCRNPLPVFQVPPVFRFFHLLGISIRHVSMATDVWSGRGSISSHLSANHRSRTRLSGDEKKLYPWGAPPSIFLLSNQPLT